MREHPRAHGSHEASYQPQAITDLVKAPAQEIQNLAQQQLSDMRASGAIIAETIAVPIAIQSPIQPLAPMCVITTRWIGGGVFGALFPLEDGTLLSGWITIKAAMRINPALNPLGTLSQETWDSDIISQKLHLLPNASALRSAARAAAKELTTQLLNEFPDRLTANGDEVAAIESSTVARRFIKAKRALLERELNEAFTLVTREDPEQTKLQQFIIQTHGDFFEASIRASALKNFQDCRIKIVHIAQGQDPMTSVIGRFIEGAIQRATDLAAPAVREHLYRNPFTPPPVEILTHPCVEAIAKTLALTQVYRDLWSILPSEERERTLRIISENAWKRASYTYAQSN